jgi:hypothetical protein
VSNRDPPCEMVGLGCSDEDGEYIEEGNKREERVLFVHILRAFGLVMVSKSISTYLATFRAWFCSYFFVSVDYPHRI